MRRLAAITVFLAAVLAARAASPFLTVDNTLLPSPAAIGARGARLAVSGNGVARLSWIEPLAEGAALRFSTLAPGQTRWSEPQIVVAAPAFFPAENEAPQIVSWSNKDGRSFLAAIWTGTTVGTGGSASWSISTDDGKSWNPAETLTAAVSAQRFPSLTPLADGRLLATWMDARGLCARIIHPAAASECVVDPSINPTSGLAPAVPSSSGAWIAYRRIVDGEKRDIGLARFDGQTWKLSKALELDRDTSASPAPADAAVIAGTSSRLAAAWFSTMTREPRILFSQSAGASGPFLLPLRIEDAKPLGRPTLALLDDGTAFVAWLEHYNGSETAIWLRRVARSGELSVPVLLATAPSAAAIPRLALRATTPGGNTQLLLAFTSDAEGVSQVVTRLITVPPPAASASISPCNCPVVGDMARGYAIRGTVHKVESGGGNIVLQHTEIAGVLAAGTTLLKVEPTLLSGIAEGTEIAGRVEQRGNDWWLFDARLIIREKNRSTSQP